MYRVQFSATIVCLSCKSPIVIKKPLKKVVGFELRLANNFPQTIYRAIQIEIYSNYSFQRIIVDLKSLKLRRLNVNKFIHS